MHLWNLPRTVIADAAAAAIAAGGRGQEIHVHLWPQRCLHHITSIRLDRECSLLLSLTKLLVGHFAQPKPSLGTLPARLAPSQGQTCAGTVAIACCLANELKPGNVMTSMLLIMSQPP